MWEKLKLNNIYLKYIDIYNFIKKEIENDNLNGKLPSIRKLASILGTNPNTIARVYSKLEIDGYIYTKMGSACFVLRNENQNLETFENEDFLSNEKLKIDFITSSPNISFLPIDEIQKEINYIINLEREKALIYDDIKGDISLREAIYKQLIKKNIKVELKNIQIISGAQQGIDIIASSLNIGDTMITENPTYIGAIKSFSKNKNEIIRIDLEDDGIDLEKIKEVLKDKKIKYLYIIPNFQSPTGIVTSIKKRKELLKLSSLYDFYIIEDDSTTDLFYGNIPPKSLKYFDKNDRVIYIKSFSKIFMPGFRLGFMIIPNELLPIFKKYIHLEILNTSPLYQKVFARFLSTGSLEKHIEIHRKKFKKIRDTLIKNLKNIDDLKFLNISGGYSLWIKLPNKISSKYLYNRLIYRGIGIVPGIMYGDKFDNYIKINFSNIELENVKIGINLILKEIEYFKSLNKII